MRTADLWKAMLLVRMLDLREETRKIQILSVSAGQRASDENESMSMKAG